MHAAPVALARRADARGRTREEIDREMPLRAHVSVHDATLAFICGTRGPVLLYYYYYGAAPG